MIHSFQGNMKPAFGHISTPVRFGADAAQPSPESTPTGETSDVKDQADIGKKEQPAQAPELTKEQIKARRKHNFRVGKGVFLRTVVPFASIFMWMGGPLGMAASMGVSYVSGRLGRRVWNKIDDSQLTGTAQKTKDLMNALGDPAAMKEDEIVNKFNGVLDEALEPTKLAAIPLIGGLLSRSGMIAKTLKTARIPYNSGAANLMRSYVRVKQVRSMGGGAAAAAQSVGAKAFFLLNAAGANHAVAQIAAREKSNFTALPKAAWEAVSRIFFLTLIPKLGGALLRRLGSSNNGLIQKVGEHLKDTIPTQGLTPPKV